MPTEIRLTIGDVTLDATLNDSETAQAIAAQLPTTVRMSRWGDEYYGSIGDVNVGEASDARDLMEIGELAYWPPGSALCIFFGPTPASTGAEPRAASPVNPVGRVASDPAPLKSMGGSISVEIAELV